MRMFLTAAFAFALALEGETTSAESLEAETRALAERHKKLRSKAQESPAEFIAGAIQLSEDYSAVAQRYSALTQSYGAGQNAVTVLTEAATLARHIKEPGKAIGLYERAAAIHSRRFAGAKFVFHEQIADIYQFDLADPAAAAKSLKDLRQSLQAVPSGDSEWGPMYVWKKKWLDAEIAYLEKGDRFKGDVSAEELGGFVAQIYFGAGATAMRGVLDPALNPFQTSTMTPEETATKLAALPPSHTTFLSTWMFARDLPSKESAQRWLDRNDPAGYWKASLLTLAAAAERRVDAKSDPRFDVVTSIVRTNAGSPTAFALLGREYAKSHRIPPFNHAVGH